MTDLGAFARELMKDAKRNLGTKLDWVAVDHGNTDNPHFHILVRGKADDGKDLVISRDCTTQSFHLRPGAAGRLGASPFARRPGACSNACACRIDRTGSNGG
jgi:type IV secretory pathway VirD2 relaxase